MKIGISVTSAFARDSGRDGAAQMIERARTARQSGLDSLFVGDHHVTATPYYQNSPILGRMLAEWSGPSPRPDGGPGTVGALYLLPLWNPVLLAEQVATLACIAEGPFVMQCALGGERRQSAGMGVDLGRRVAMFEASLDLIRRLWAGETVDEPRFWGLSRARISPLPPEPVDVWIGATAPPAINRAARLGDAWLATPGTTIEQAAESANVYRQACAEHGREPKAVAIRRDIYVGADARRVVAPYAAAGYRGFPEQALMYGDEHAVAEQMRKFVDAGYTDVIVRNLTSDQGQALATIERLQTVRELLDG